MCTQYQVVNTGKNMEIKMTKKIIYSLLMLAFFSTGCVGLIIGPFRETSIQINSKLIIEQPLQINKESAAKIKKIAISDTPWGIGKGFPHLQVGGDERIYTTKMRLLISELEKNKQFEIISPNEYQAQQIKTGSIAANSMTTEEERKNYIKENGKSLQADAVILLAEGAGKVNMIKSVLQIGFIGTVTVPTNMIIEIYSTKTGDIIYHQVQQIQYSIGGMNIGIMPNAELERMIYPTIKPMVDDFLQFFSSNEPIAMDKKENKNTQDVPPPADNKPEVATPPEKKAAAPIEPVKQGEIVEKIEKTKKPVQNEVSQPQPRVHIVKAKDTLGSIAKQYTGSANNWKKLMQYNNLKSQALKLGQKIMIPAD